MAKTWTLYFYVDDYEDRLATLLSAAQSAERANTGRRVGDGSDYKALIEEFNALRDEAREKARKVVVQAISRRAWLKLREDHPPRVEGVSDEVRQRDAMWGINTESVEEDLVYAAVVEPEFKSRAAFDEWALEELTAAEFGRISQLAFKAISDAPDPKSLRALPIQNGDATSDLPESTE